MKPTLDLLPQQSTAESSCAALLKVLADDTRLRVVEQLLDGPKTVSEVNDNLGVEPTLLSHHLKVLKQNCIVTSRREGRYVMYTLTPQLLQRRKGKSIDLGCCTLAFS